MSKRILVIDDDKAIRKSFSLALEDSGYQLETAETGEEGIEKERSKKYDVIFLDLKMSGMDGVEVLKRIRKVNKHTPIYILTAFHKEFLDDLKTAEKEGINYELLRKPIIDDQILMVIKSVVK